MTFPNMEHQDHCRTCAEDHGFGSTYYQITNFEVSKIPAVSSTSAAEQQNLRLRECRAVEAAEVRKRKIRCEEREELAALEKAAKRIREETARKLEAV